MQKSSMEKLRELLAPSQEPKNLPPCEVHFVCILSLSQIQNIMDQVSPDYAQTIFPHTPKVEFELSNHKNCPPLVFKNSRVP